MSTLKYIIGYNHYSQKYYVINNKTTSKRCLRCNKIEDWQYVIQSKTLNKVNKIFTEKVERELKKSTKMNNEDDTIEYVIINMRKFLCDDREYIMNQVIIRKKYAFQWYVVKEQIGDTNIKGRHININKRLVKLLVMHYVEF